MANKSKKHRDGVVYSTSNNFEYEYDNENEEIETKAPEKQNLKVLLDNKAKKKGKKATLITGFIGAEDNLKDLAKILKTKCAVGGAAKDGEIIIQGDFREKVVEILKQMGYKARKI